MCTKLRTVAASKNRDHARNLSSRTLVVTFNRSHRQSYHVAISLTIAWSRYTNDGVILHARPVRGESHNQHNTTGEVATGTFRAVKCYKTRGFIVSQKTMQSSRRICFFRPEICGCYATLCPYGPETQMRASANNMKAAEGRTQKNSDAVT